MAILLRQQSAVEFLITYSFAIMVLSMVLVSAYLIANAYATKVPISSTCTINPLLTCQQSILTYNSVGQYFNYLLLFRNNLNFVIQFPANALNLTTTGLTTAGKQITFGNCVPNVVAIGSQVICQAKISGASLVKQGTNEYAQFQFAYNLCSSSNTLTCSSSSPYYSTGYSFQTLSPAITNLYNITIKSYNGIVLINGQSYFNNSVLYLVSGTYNLYGIPTSGYSFVSWTWNGPGTPISPTSSQNSILTLVSNGNIIAQFH
jgi:hypothetical protein